MFRLPMLMVLIAGLWLGGCTTPSYVNVPALSGDTAFNNPDSGTVLDVEVAALEYLLRQEPPTGRYAVRLPEGTSGEAYRRVISRLPSGGDRVADAEGPVPVYEVAQVQIRGLHAQADIIRPDSRGEEQLVTVYLGTDINGWYGTRKREWHTSVDRAMRMARPGPRPAAPVGSGARPERPEDSDR